MKELFDYYSDSGATSFNEDIGAWDTSGVTTMERMFWAALSFNHPLGDWNVDKVTSMFAMFSGARAFDQDLGWCVDIDDVGLYFAFDDTLCESTSCGVAQGQFKTEDGGCESTRAPTPETDAAPLRGGRVAVALVVGGVMTLLA
jgi:surface protein